MSKELTEKWKNGELENGFYYTSISEKVMRYYSKYTENFIQNNEEILAPVPTYKEYLALESDSLAKKEAEEQIAELENKLKIAVTALSRISDMVYHSTNCDNFAGVANDALVKLGENK